jgi:dienelactone hydrolase
MKRAFSRRALAALAVAAVPRIGSSQEHDASGPVKEPYGWIEETHIRRKVYVRGSGRRIVVLLHEINGLSPACVDFGVELVSQGFHVHLPLLFGHILQSSAFLGYIESCWFGGFECKSPGRTDDKDPMPVQWVRNYVQSLERDADAIAVIGMCETGAYPLASMRQGSRVKAVVLSQPALPLFPGEQRAVGISMKTMETAKASGIPILAFRFLQDTISTADRFNFLQDYFGPEQFTGHQWEGPPIHQTLTHRLHAVLTGPFWKVRKEARLEATAFLHRHLS